MLELNDYVNPHINIDAIVIMWNFIYQNTKLLIFDQNRNRVKALHSSLIVSHIKINEIWS